MTIIEALAQAEQEQQRCLVLLSKDNRDVHRVYLAAGKLWVYQGNPACLEPFIPSIADMLNVEWEPGDDALPGS